MLKKYHKLSGFWSDIEPLGPVVQQAAPKIKKAPVASNARRYPRRNKATKSTTGITTRPPSQQPVSHHLDLTEHNNMSIQLQRQLLQAQHAATKATNAAAASIAAANAAAERVTAAVKALNESQRTPTRNKRPKVHRPKHRRHGSPTTESSYTGESETPSPQPPPKRSKGNRRHRHHRRRRRRDHDQHAMAGPSINYCIPQPTMFQYNNPMMVSGGGSYITGNITPVNTPPMYTRVHPMVSGGNGMISMNGMGFPQPKW